MSIDCRFCTIDADGLQEKLYQNIFFYSILDIYPVLPGHALIIPKRHVVSYLQTEPYEWQWLGDAVCRTSDIINHTDFESMYRRMLAKVEDRSKPWIERILLSPYLHKAPNGYNVGINEGAAAGRTLAHLHAHLIPRFYGDVEDPSGGIRNILPNKGKSP